MSFQPIQERIDEFKNRDAEYQFIRAESIMTLCIAGARVMMLGNDITEETSLMFSDEERKDAIFGLENAFYDYQLWSDARWNEQITLSNEEERNLRARIKELETRVGDAELKAGAYYLENIEQRRKLAELEKEKAAVIPVPEKKTRSRKPREVL
jgi:hypothetical protein